MLNFYWYYKKEDAWIRYKSKTQSEGTKLPTSRRLSTDSTTTLTLKPLSGLAFPSVSRGRVHTFTFSNVARDRKPELMECFKELPRGKATDKQTYYIIPLSNYNPTGDPCCISTEQNSPRISFTRFFPSLIEHISRKRKIFSLHYKLGFKTLMYLRCINVKF